MGARGVTAFCDVYHFVYSTMPYLTREIWYGIVNKPNAFRLRQNALVLLTMLYPMQVWPTMLYPTIEMLWYGIVNKPKCSNADLPHHHCISPVRLSANPSGLFLSGELATVSLTASQPPQCINNYKQSSKILYKL